MIILDCVPAGVIPPKGGGTKRIHNINLFLSKYYKILMFSHGIRKFEFKLPLNSWVKKINYNYYEVRYIDPYFIISSYLLNKLYNIGPIFSSNFLFINNPNFVKNLINSSDIIKIEHPWQFKYFHNMNKKKVPIILTLHDIGIELALQTIKNGFLKKKLIKIISTMEDFAIKNADKIIVVSEDDKKRLKEIYGTENKKVVVVPNGVNTKEFKSTSNKEEIKKKYGMENKKVVIFSGWKHIPNLHAVNQIIKISKDLNEKNVVFIIIGSVGEFFKKIKSNNIIFTGYVDKVDDYFAMADLALNPMISGTGTNIKILEYLSYGIPTITTKKGCRGYNLINRKEALICDLKEFPEKISYLLNNDIMRNKLSFYGKKFAKKYDWNNIAKIEKKIYDDII
ncbi:MAG: glycosyltransferase family 4 protein [Candidatus Aenigmarchaeota archaeon]|nr:glycosyltransferase family 4 protein [Candidatus Aenigmarchaeota archaeon]